MGSPALARLSRAWLVALLGLSPALALAQAAEPTVPLTVPLNAYKALVESRIEGASDLLRVVADSPEAKSGKWNLAAPRMEPLREAEPDANTIFYALPDGTYWTVDQGASGKSIADRPYFKDLLAGKSVAGVLVLSRVTGKRSVVIAEPVRRDGRVVAMVGIALSVERLSGSVRAALGLPPDMVFYALDSAGQIALHYDPTLMFAYPMDIGGPSLQAAVTRMLSEKSGVVRYEFRGVHKTVCFTRSERLGWVFALGRNEPGAARGRAP